MIGVDVATTTVAPTVTLDGQPFPTGGGSQARIVLRPSAGGEAVIGTTDLTPIDPRPVIDSAYRIGYEWLIGDDFPRNRREPVGVAYMAEQGLSLGLRTGIACLAAIARRQLRLGRGPRFRLQPGQTIPATRFASSSG